MGVEKSIEIFKGLVQYDPVFKGLLKANIARSFLDVLTNEHVANIDEKFGMWFCREKAVEAANHFIDNLFEH